LKHPIVELSVVLIKVEEQHIGPVHNTNLSAGTCGDTRRGREGEDVWQRHNTQFTHLVRLYRAYTIRKMWSLKRRCAANCVRLGWRWSCTVHGTWFGTVRTRLVPVAGCFFCCERYWFVAAGLGC